MGLSELSVISWVSDVEVCPLNGVPLYARFTVDIQLPVFQINANFSVSRCTQICIKKKVYTIIVP